MIVGVMKDRPNFFPHAFLKNCSDFIKLNKKAGLKLKRPFLNPESMRGFISESIRII